MTAHYQPPFHMSADIVQLVADISEQLGRMAAIAEGADQGLRLRRLHRIRTIQGSLAIEGNTLSEAQITAILDGKRVLAPAKDIREARNAIQAYEQFPTWQPASERDLLQAHRTLMAGLIADAGSYRSGNVGVMNADVVVHMAPPASRVPPLMADLLTWLATTKQHPLIASSVFHYEFEFIHPFSDGNGRMGRLWQTLILSQWQPLLAQLPIESMVHAYQDDYYQALNLSNQKSEATPFIEFMLSVIAQTIRTEAEEVTPQATQQATPQVDALLKVLAIANKALNRQELQQLLKLKDRESFRQRYLRPALAAGLLEMTRPEQPNSPLQQYRLSKLGLQHVRKV